MRHSTWMMALVLALASVFAGCTGDDGGADNNGENQCEAGEVYNEISGACQPAEDAGTDSGDDEDTGTVADTGGEEDTGTVADTGTTQDTGTSEDTGMTGDTATLTGVVTRTSEATPEEDGKGKLYIALFEEDPVANQGSTSEPVAFQLIENADVAETTSEVPYELTGIPPRADEYYIAAFLDDDGTSDDVSDPSEAGPDTGDLVAVGSTLPPTSPSVTVDTATEVTFTIELNFNMF